MLSLFYGMILLSQQIAIWPQVEIYIPPNIKEIHS